MLQHKGLKTGPPGSATEVQRFGEDRVGPCSLPRVLECGRVGVPEPANRLSGGQCFGNAQMLLNEVQRINLSPCRSQHAGQVRGVLDGTERVARSGGLFELHAGFFDALRQSSGIGGSKALEFYGALIEGG